jgi:beta-lactamase superfamily II metal-dependent hydrolase
LSRIIALFVVIALFPCISSAQNLLRVYFFDVGQGDAILVVSPSGPNVLYDGGDSPSTILTHIDAVGVSRIDLVVASHNHTDHIGGLAEVIRRFRPRFYLDNGFPATTLAYKQVLEAIQIAGTELLEPANRQIRLGDDTSLRVLPPSGIKAWNQNDNSVGLILTFGQFRLSLGGDAEQRQWDWWIEHHSDALGRVQVHKSSHHGSASGDTATALSVLAPDVVIISAGRNNGPHPQALRLYAEQGSTILRTDLNGTIVIEAETSGRYAIRVARGDGVRPPVVSSPVPEDQHR